MVSAKYVTSNGHEINLSKRPYFLLADNELHDYEWEYEDNGIAITQIKWGKGIKSIPFKIYVYASSRQMAADEKNALTSAFENDVTANMPGKLYIGNSYMKGYVVASQKSQWVDNKKRLIISAAILTDCPVWCTERTNAYRKSAYTGEGSAAIDYPYNYPYDYTVIDTPILINDSPTEAGFVIRIYGPALNPVLSVGDNSYQVNCTVASGEQLLITSSGAERSINLIGAYGEKTNMFSARNTAYNVFKKIPAGSNAVSWNYGFDFDITVISERGEPLWT